jgi:soluble lytic murein transglycosylase
MVLSRNIIKIFSIFIAGVLAFCSISVFALFVTVCNKQYDEEIADAVSDVGIDFSLVKAVVCVESSFDEDAISFKGAIGLMQVLPSTANFISDGVVDLFDPQVNLAVGVKYLSYLLNKFNDEKTALAAYNAGEGRVLSWLNDKRYSSDAVSLRYIPFKETRNYVKRVLALKSFYNLF